MHLLDNATLKNLRSIICEGKKVVEGKISEMALKGTKYTITAQAFDRKTNRPVGKERDEVIDVATNRLFKGVKNIGDIESAYESFWNDLNPNSKEVVKVSSVKAGGEVDEGKINEKVDLVESTSCEKCGTRISDSEADMYGDKCKKCSNKRAKEQNESKSFWKVTVNNLGEGKLPVTQDMSDPKTMTDLLEAQKTYGTKVDLVAKELFGFSAAELTPDQWGKVKKVLDIVSATIADEPKEVEPIAPVTDGQVVNEPELEELPAEEVSELPIEEKKEVKKDDKKKVVVKK
jgi:hypothetical protein